MLTESSALFLLFIQYAAPTGTFDDDTLDAVRSAGAESTFNWPKIGWIFVFQYPVVEILSVAIQEATEATGTYCLDSLNPKYAHLWIEILESISIAFCVTTILAFRNRFKDLMKVRRGLAKLLCFKAIVFIRFSQSWVFSILLEYHAIKAGTEFSYNDVLWGIPGVLTCVEMILFSAAFWYAFSSTEYGSGVHRETPLPMWKAALHALNPWDLLVGMWKVVPLSIEMSRDGEWKRWRVAMKESVSRTFFKTVSRTSLTNPPLHRVIFERRLSLTRKRKAKGLKAATKKLMRAENPTSGLWRWKTMRLIVTR